METISLLSKWGVHLTDKLNYRVDPALRKNYTNEGALCVSETSDELEGKRRRRWRKEREREKEEPRRVERDISFPDARTGRMKRIPVR